MKLIDIAYLIEETSNLFNAIEYDSDSPLHYKDYKETWQEYGYKLKKEDSKMIDEATEIIQEWIEYYQTKIDRYDRIMQWIMEE